MELDLFDETGKITEEQTKMVKTLLEFAGSHINLPEDTEMSVTFVDNLCNTSHQSGLSRKRPTD